MFSQRFGKSILITDHARGRMVARAVSEALLRDIIETGEVRYKDEARIWIAKRYADRATIFCVWRSSWKRHW